ncbi:glycosyltransferase family 4 protein [Malikia spinosa]|uniref:glycosyltransferase family 4 protein n=1 Tax=Malikia spinosa TaxID=86180 RepID=UPI003FA2960A
MQIVGANNFRFCATQPNDLERTRLGWNIRNEESWILRAGEVEIQRIQFEEWWDNADIVLCGDRRFNRMLDRVNHGKICFYMSERWWKPPIGIARMLSPNFFMMAKQFRYLAKNPAFHYLPMGPFAERDIKILSNFKRNIWRWGYFTDVPAISLSNEKDRNKLKILWVGRMLDWKNVDTLMKALSELKKEKVNFELTLVGDGPEKLKLKKMSLELLNNESVFFLDPVPATKIPIIMAQHDIYVLPSSAYEGWGAVINEAMSCGCAVIASSAAGAAAAIIENEINGFLFQPGDWRGLSRLLKYLSNNSSIIHTISNEARATISKIWSPNVAANRFYNVCEALLKNGEIPIYKKGPMSRSGFISYEKNID